MACISHECYDCGEWWSDNSLHSECPKCGSWDSIGHFDEPPEPEEDLDFEDDDAPFDDGVGGIDLMPE
jgi:predicted  nucleic acid-binding Zn-ribbon protein